MLLIEQNAAGANITTASDAVWYVVETISTVGYGDQYPVTNPGRILGSIIIVVGVGIFGTFTGYLANFFLSPKKATESGEAPSDATRQIAHLKELLAQQQTAVDEVEVLLRRGPAGLGVDAHGDERAPSWRAMKSVRPRATAGAFWTIRRWPASATVRRSAWGTTTAPAGAAFDETRDTVGADDVEDGQPDPLRISGPERELLDRRHLAWKKRSASASGVSERTGITRSSASAVTVTAHVAQEAVDGTGGVT